MTTIQVECDVQLGDVLHRATDEDMRHYGWMRVGNWLATLQRLANAGDLPGFIKVACEMANKQGVFVRDDRLLQLVPQP